MKISAFRVMVWLLVFTACQKTSEVNNPSGMSNDNSVAFTDTIKIPINDLATGTYLGYTGGLYPAGIDTPSGQYAKDLLRFAMKIKPLDSSGKASDSGKVLFISLGASTGGNNMKALILKTVGNPETNPFLLLLNCNNGAGSATLNNIANPKDSYWDHVSLILRSHHVGYKQVQVVYFETDDSLPVNSFPQRANIVRDNFSKAMQVCKSKFKHLKLVYVLGRTTTFDKILVPNQEPCPYYNGWAYKFYIQDQINGTAATRYKGDSAVAPLVTWGWYQWADGTTTPRLDGFVWTKDMTVDGMHADSTGQDTLATRFQNFLLKDRYAGVWYVNHTEP